jgi:sugar-specific transcriptional regulator TrmB
MLNINQLNGQLKRYGLTENESLIYTHLLRTGNKASVLQIARALKLGRTPVYNALDRLEDKGIVEKTLGDNGHNYTASSPDNLERYWAERSARQEKLGDKLPALVASLEALSAPAGYKSQINYFSGHRGIKQITYNSLRAKDDLYIYEVNSDMTAFMTAEQAERFREIWAERNTTIHQLTNKTEFEDFTSVKKIITDLWDIRHMPPEILKINFETLIYNDTVALYSYIGSEVFGVEIKNPALAEMQKQIFRAMQNLAKPMKITSEKGAAMIEVKGGK